MAIHRFRESSLRSSRVRYNSLATYVPRRVRSPSIKAAAEAFALQPGNLEPIEVRGLVNIAGNDLGFADVRIVDGDLAVTALTDQTTLFSSTEDTHSAWLIVRGNLSIDSGVVLTPPVRKLFLVVYATGNITGPGEISMTCRGANHSGVGTSGGFTMEQDILIVEGDYAGITNPIVPAVGGAGTDTNGAIAGSPGSNGGTGGGGGGNRVISVNRRKEGAGRAGTCFSGGSGGGSGYHSGNDLDNYLAARTQYPIDAEARGGAGGFAVTNHYGIAAGEGNPGGSYILSDSPVTNPYGGKVSASDSELANPLPGGTGGTAFVISSNSVSSITVTSNAPGGARGSLLYGGGAGAGSVNVVAPSVTGVTLQAESIAGSPFTTRNSTPVNGGLGSARILTPTAAPAITSAPTISYSDLKVGTTLAAVPGDSTSSPLATTTWQWLFDGVDAGDGTGLYTLTESDAGKTLVLRQTDTNVEGSAQQDSAPIAIDALSAPAIATAPAVALGTHSNVLETTTGAVSGNPEPAVTWSWEESADGVSGWSAVADEATRFLEARGSRAGKFFRVTQTATSSQGVVTSVSNVVEIAAARDTLDLITSAVLAFSVPRRLRSGVSFPYRVIETAGNTTQDVGFDAEGVTDTAAMEAFVTGAGATEGGLDAAYDQSGHVNAVDMDFYQAGFPQFLRRPGGIETYDGVHVANANHNGYRYLANDATGWATRPAGNGVAIVVFARPGADTKFSLPSTRAGDAVYFSATSGGAFGFTLDVNGQRSVVTPTDTQADAYNAIPATGFCILVMRGIDYTQAEWDGISFSGAWRQTSFDGYQNVIEHIHLADPTETEIAAIERSMAAFYGITAYEG